MKRLLIKCLSALCLLVAAYGLWISPKSAAVALGQESIIATADGASISFYQAGPKEGLVVVLIASLGRSVSDFNLLVPGLNAAGFYTIAVDLRGVGRSTLAPDQKAMTLFALADDLKRVLEHIGIGKNNPITVIGHAFGNRLVRAFSSKNVDSVNAIVLLAAGGSQKLAADQRPAQALANSFDWRLFPRKRVAEIKFAFFADDNDVPPSWLRGWYRLAAKLQIQAVQSTPVSQWRDGGGRAPILVVQAAQDRIAPAESTSAKLLADFPGRVTVVTIAQAGHALLPEQPLAIERAIVEFLTLQNTQESQ